MCGITAVVDKEGRAPYLALKIASKQEERGRLGAGVAYPKQDFIGVVKTPGITPSELLDSHPEIKDIDANIAIGHNRWPTSEVVRVKTHPFVNEDSDLALIHNGILFPRKYREVIELLEDEFGHEFAGRCDSELALHAYEETVGDYTERLQSLGEFLEEGRSSVALLILRKKEGDIIGWRDVEPMYFAGEDGKMAIASTRHALRQFFDRRNITEIPSHTPIRITKNKILIG